MKDPFYRMSPAQHERLMADKGVQAAVSRLTRLKVVVAVIAGLLLAAVLLVWRFG